MGYKGIALVCLCYVENATIAHIHYAIRRIRRKTPDVFILVALLGNSAEMGGQESLVNTDFVQGSLRATVDKILAYASSSSNNPGSCQSSMLVATHRDHDVRSREAEIPRMNGKVDTTTHEQALEFSGGAVREAKWAWKAAAAALTVLIFGGGWLYWSLHGGATARYVTEAVGRGSVIRTVDATGVVNPATTAPIGVNVSGKIEALYCDRGAKVKEGQLCAQIDPRPYRKVVDREKANLAVAQAGFRRDKIRLERTKAALERYQILAKRRAVSRIDFGDARAAYRQAQAHTVLEDAAIVRRRAALHAAEVDLAHTEIASPIDGTVVARNIETGQMIGASKETPLFLVAPDLTVVRVDANMSAKDIGEIKLGDRASLKVDTLPNRVFTGEVCQISETPQIIQDVATHEVVICATNSDLSLTPGTRTAVQIVLARRDNVIRVPDQSLRYSASRLDAGDQDLKTPPAGWARVWVLRNGKPIAVTVRLGLDDGVYIEVVEGDLLPRDQLILGEGGDHPEKITPKFLSLQYR